MRRIGLDQGYQGPGTVCHRQVKACPSLPHRPTLDCIVADRRAGKLPVPRSAQNCDRLAQSSNLALAPGQRERRLSPALSSGPREHSTVCSEIVGREIEGAR